MKAVLFREAGLYRKWGDPLLRDVMNAVESRLLPGTLYLREDLLRLFEAVMAEKGIAPRSQEDVDLTNG